MIKNILLNRWFLLAVFLVLALTTLNYFTLPWFWVSIYALILTIYFSLTSKKESYKLIFAYLSIVPVVVLVSEIYFSENTKNNIKQSGGYSENYFKGDKYLGYAPTPNKISSSIKTYNEETIYDVKYTILDNGLRYVPSSNINSESCLLFFGGSVTFGEGLNDSETLANLVGKKTGNNLKIYNFGFHGYGPHQMLSAIENGIVDKVVQNCSSIHAIYTGIPMHIARAAGLAPWDQNGPRYKIINNEVILSGTFRDNFTPNITKKIFDFIFNKSETYKAFHRHKYETTDNDLKLYIAILSKSMKMLDKKFDNTKFSILFWDQDSPAGGLGKKNSGQIIGELKDTNLKFYLVSDILEGYKDNKLQYAHHIQDMHPNFKANNSISDYIGDVILQKPTNRQP